MAGLFRGLLVIGSEHIGNEVKVIGTFEKKPFELIWCEPEATGTVEGEFSDEERQQLLTVWEIQN